MVILKQLCEMFILVLIGALFTRVGLIPKGFNDTVSKFIMNISLPASIVMAFYDGLTKEMWIQSAEILIGSFILMLFYVGINLVLYRKAPADEQPIYRFAILTPNTNFLCYPLVTALYGNTGVLLLSMALLPNRIFAWSVGIMYFTKEADEPLYKKILKCLPMWAVVIGVVIASLHIKFPTPLEHAINTFAATNTGLSMYLIGSGIAFVKLKTFVQKKAWKFCLLRLVLIPMVVIGACLLTGVDGAVAGTLCFMSAMPAGTLTVVFTKEYNKNTEVAASIVTLSMILCAITLPILSNICLTIF